MKHKPYESREVIYIGDDEPKRCCGSGGFVGFLIVAALIGMFFVGARYIARSNCCNRSAARVQQQRTWQTLGNAAERIEQFRDEHNGRVPEGVEGNRIAIQYLDAWGNELRYEIHDDAYLMRSAGRDGEFDTRDDLVTRTHVDLTQQASTTLESEPHEEQ